ncbi:hypothetical protein NQ314_018519 [Rhamnusium bicolor]|uniref:Uncharacterized protein n=1 Tax=Rhamnusium bicolor TaxID=1586634 RepID=A0AAV8WQ32_9CUCU|nr:hypothetical protein NQ314_018519 [Rhamnusium bicolor]
MVRVVPVARIREKNGSRSGRRCFTRQYGFEINEVRQTVCQKFFRSTLNISETFITTALQKKKDGGIIEEDQRGKHINKIPEYVRQGVRNHIQKFPVIESHYSRERSKKKYLGNDLNISRMYELYKTECHESNTPENLIAKQCTARYFKQNLIYLLNYPIMIHAMNVIGCHCAKIRQKKLQKEKQFSNNILNISMKPLRGMLLKSEIKNWQKQVKGK